MNKIMGLLLLAYSAQSMAFYTSPAAKRIYSELLKSHLVKEINDVDNHLQKFDYFNIGGFECSKNEIYSEKIVEYVCQLQLNNNAKYNPNLIYDAMEGHNVGIIYGKNGTIIQGRKIENLVCSKAPKKKARCHIDI